MIHTTVSASLAGSGVLEAILTDADTLQTKSDADFSQEAMKIRFWLRNTVPSPTFRALARLLAKDCEEF